MTQPTSRRFFLGAATALAATRVWGANDKINVAIVGLGGRGTNHLNIYSKLPDARVAVVCDINQTQREVAQALILKNTGEKPKEVEDMRQAFSDSGVDAVSIATPGPIVEQSVALFTYLPLATVGLALITALIRLAAFSTSLSVWKLTLPTGA